MHKLLTASAGHFIISDDFTFRRDTFFGTHFSKMHDFKNGIIDSFLQEENMLSFAQCKNDFELKHLDI